MAGEHHVSDEQHGVSSPLSDPLPMLTRILRSRIRSRRTSLLGTFPIPLVYILHLTMLCRQLAFLKMYSTRCAAESAADAVQMFGGRGVTQTGMGKFIEHVRYLPSSSQSQG